MDGVFQTALVEVFGGKALGNGNNRIAFGHDGSIYVGKTALSWAGDKGIVRVKWKGAEFFALEKVKATRGGFDLTFTEEVDPATLSSIAIEGNTYKYHKAYGSPKVDVTSMPVKNAERTDQGRGIRIDIGGLKEGYLHAIDLTGLRSKNGKPLMGKKAWYHAIKAPK